MAGLKEDNVVVAEVKDKDDGSVGEAFRQWSDGEKKQEVRFIDVIGR